VTESQATKTCQYCRAAIPRSAQKCKACGEWVVRRGGCGTLLVLVMLLAVAAMVVSEDARYLGKSLLDQVSKKDQEWAAGGAEKKRADDLSKKAQEWAAGGAEKKRTDDWVSLPCELSFANELSAQHHGGLGLYEFRGTSVRYNKESLELELTFRYRTEGGVYPRVRVELIDKNNVTLVRSPYAQIAHQDNVAKLFGAKLVSTSQPNTLSWTFARMYYPDTVMVRVVVKALD
jgi:hypothetical protein